MSSGVRGVVDLPAEVGVIRRLPGDFADGVGGQDVALGGVVESTVEDSPLRAMVVAAAGFPYIVSDSAFRARRNQFRALLGVVQCGHREEVVLEPGQRLSYFDLKIPGEGP